MQIFNKTITVVKDDLDQLNHVNNVRYVQWVQDIAEAHWTQNANINITNKYYWVLVKHTIEYNSQAVLGDVLKLKTFVEKSEGVSSIRIVEIYNASNDKLIVKSETKWCFMDMATHRPTRITEEVATLFN